MNSYTKYTVIPSVGLAVAWFILMIVLTSNNQQANEIPSHCYIVGSAVSPTCIENNRAPRCATEDGNDGVSDCWWIDPHDLRVWYRPKDR